ncbi:MAG: hypothetical protein HDT15_07100 [Oscillibacter sp.]|nr:hypothetical protein [Oscillibacter sp.]
MTAQELKSGTVREAAMCLFWMYCGGMAVITLVPEPGWVLFALRGDEALMPYFDLGRLSYRISIVPFSQLDSLFNIAGNIVMFLPFGFFAALLWRKFNWTRAFALGLGITCCIECWQIFLGRYFDIDDIILNTLGVFCGWLLWVMLGQLVPGFVKRFHVWEI